MREVWRIPGSWVPVRCVDREMILQKSYRSAYVKTTLIFSEDVLMWAIFSFEVNFVWVTSSNVYVISLPTALSFSFLLSRWVEEIIQPAKCYALILVPKYKTHTNSFNVRGILGSFLPALGGTNLCARWMNISLVICLDLFTGSFLSCCDSMGYCSNLGWRS